MEESEQENILRTQHISVTPSFSSLLQSHADIVSTAFRNAFREEVSLAVIETELIRATASSSTLNKLQLILMDEPVKLYHSSVMKTWFTQNSESWLAFTDSLTDEYVCAIHTDSDFSKSYIFIAPHHNKQVSKMISNFLPFKEVEVIPEDVDSAPPLTVSIYKPFVDYLKNDEEMSAILKSKRQRETPDTPLVMMDFSGESLKILRSKLETITSQSFILSKSEARSFMTIKDEFLPDIQQKYQVIGNVFNPNLSMESIVSTQQTRMVCLVSSKPDCLPVDNYIRLESCFSHNLTEYTVAKKFSNGNKIWKGETWNLPFNQRLFVELPLMQEDGMTVDFENVLTECFQILDVGTENGLKSKITGIYLTSPNSKVRKQFCSDLVKALNSFDLKHPSESSSCKVIALIVDTPKIQAKIVKGFSTENIYEKMIGKDDKNNGHGAIPKNFKTSQHGNQEDKLALWVTFYNFSGISENLTEAVRRIKQQLKMEDMMRMTCITRIHRNKLEKLFFFFEDEITEVVPDIKDQFTKSKGEMVTIVFPQDSQLQIIDTFKGLLMKIASMRVDVGITERSMLESIVSQCNDNFPNVKCTCMDESILLESINPKDNRMVEREIKSLFSQHPLEENQNYEELLTNIQKSCQISPKGTKEFPGNLQEKDEEFPSTVQENAENMPEIVQENTRNIPEIIQENAGEMTRSVQENAEEFPGNIQENTESDLQSEHTHSKCPTINVIYGDILSDNADALVCLVFSTMNKMSNIQQLILNHAGDNVKNELIACYEEQSHKILLEGKMVSTSAGNLKFKRIFYMSCPEYNISNPYNNIPDRIMLAMNDLLEASEQQYLRSIAVAICNAESFNIPLDMFFNAILDSMTSFVNKTYKRHLEAIHFVDNQKRNCKMAIEILQLCKVPVEHNLKRGRQRRNVARRETSIPCPVCFRPVVNRKGFDDCQHEYCCECLGQWLEVIGDMCPLCLNMKPQPPGEMLVSTSQRSLPGFEGFCTFHIIYKIPDGIQQRIHPNPGQIYYGTQREAYLPANEVGVCLLKMLQEAFKKHLIFTIGTSLSSHQSNVVIWNGILHKTQETGGPSVYGYPDPLYLSHLMAQLMESGITLESVSAEPVSLQIKMTAFN